MRHRGSGWLVVLCGLAMAAASVVGVGAAAKVLPNVITCCAPGGGGYTVTWTESGLPTGTNWSISTYGVPLYSTTSTIQTTLTPGAWPYVVKSINGYVSRPQSGLVIVSNKALNVAVVFSPAYYEVTFTESGLPSGTAWWVSVDGGPQAESTTGTIMIPEANGLHSYQVYPPQNYTANTVYYAVPSTGTFTVSGAPLTISTIKFSTLIFTLTLTEVGLKSGTEWEAWVNNSTVDLIGASSTSSMPFYGLYNGTYTAYIYPVSGYTGGNYQTQITISGANVKYQVTYT